MPRILDRQVLPLENMPEVTTTVPAEDFCPSTIRIRFPPYSPGHLIIEARPPTTRVKFVGRMIQRRIATPAQESSIVLMSVISTGKWPFCAFLLDNIRFLGCQWVISHGISIRVFNLYNLQLLE